MTSTPALAITVREGCNLEMIGTPAEPEITIPIPAAGVDLTKPAKAVTIMLDEEEMKFVYSSIGRVLAGKFAPPSVGE